MRLSVSIRQMVIAVVGILCFASAPQAAGRSPIEVITHDRIDARIQNLRVDEVLRLMSEKKLFEIMGSIPAGEEITLQFSGLTLSRGRSKSAAPLQLRAGGAAVEKAPSHARRENRAEPQNREQTAPRTVYGGSRRANRKGNRRAAPLNLPGMRQARRERRLCRRRNRRRRFRPRWPMALGRDAPVEGQQDHRPVAGRRKRESASESRPGGRRTTE